ncbi:MAG: transcriptional regulator [Thermosipho sp. (in: Bacteria)]|nr:transcriptional regulator [Thermosipho sp. (in: thermotogales)]
MMIPLNPIGKREIHQLESTLLFATLFRKEVLELIKDPTERLTWVDSLAVASGAIAREKAGMKIPEIAEELGRTEQTIRKHLKRESKAGQLVGETYDLIKQGKLEEMRVDIDSIFEENKKLKKENEELKNLLEEIYEKIGKLLK